MTTHVSIFSMIKSDDRGYLTSQLFAYSSKSLPAIEIIGMGKRGKIIKEKIIYWLKKRNIRLSSKRYVICLETFQRLNFDDEESVRWLELPSLMLLLVLGDVLEVSNIDHCFCAGNLGLEGNYFFPSEQLNIEKVENDFCEKNFILITHQQKTNFLINKADKILDFEDVLVHLKKP